MFVPHTRPEHFRIEKGLENTPSEPSSSAANTSAVIANGPFIDRWRAINNLGI